MSGNIFRTYQELKEAVDMWVENKDMAKDIYGEINTWQTSNITTMSCLFAGLDTFNENISSWDTSNVRDMSGMFDGASSFNNGYKEGDAQYAPGLNWNTENVVDMTAMFRKAYSFNNGEPPNVVTGNNPLLFNTGNVVFMPSMFDFASSFNQYVGDWDTSQVTNMFCMFRNTYKFNNGQGENSAGTAPLQWDTSQVTNMEQMFLNNEYFNQDISSWNTSQVINMFAMFSGASSFNQDISGWDTQNVANMSYMFYGAQSFNQDITDWNTPQITDPVTQAERQFFQATQWLAYYERIQADPTNFNGPPNQWQQKIILFSDDFSSNTLDKWFVKSVVGEKQWRIESSYGNPAPCAYITGFSSGPQENEDWLISKPIDLAGLSYATLTFQSLVRFEGPELEVYIGTGYNEGNPNEDGTWIQIYPILDTNTDSWNSWTGSGNIDLSSYVDETINIAFKYVVSTDSQAAVYEIDNVLVTGNY